MESGVEHGIEDTKRQENERKHVTTCMNIKFIWRGVGNYFLCIPGVYLHYRVAYFLKDFTLSLKDKNLILPFTSIIIIS